LASLGHLVCCSARIDAHAGRRFGSFFALWATSLYALRLGFFRRFGKKRLQRPPTPSRKQPRGLFQMDCETQNAVKQQSPCYRTFDTLSWPRQNVRKIKEVQTTRATFVRADSSHTEVTIAEGFSIRQSPLETQPCCFAISLDSFRSWGALCMPLMQTSCGPTRCCGSMDSQLEPEKSLKRKPAKSYAQT
jgi:hypothetical protein